MKCYNKEIWKPCYGFLAYMASTLGRIKNKQNKILKMPIEKRGYKTITLYKDKKRIHKAVHRLIALSFLSLPTLKHEVHHLDGNKQNNKIDNLKFVTRGENMQATYDLGFQPCRKGEKHWINKLTNKEIRKIRAMNSGGILQYEIAKKFKVCPSNISRILSRETWQHI